MPSLGRWSRLAWHGGEDHDFNPAFVQRSHGYDAFGYVNDGSVYSNTVYNAIVEAWVEEVDMDCGP